MVRDRRQALFEAKETETVDSWHTYLCYYCGRALLNPLTRHVVSSSRKNGGWRELQEELRSKLARRRRFNHGIYTGVRGVIILQGWMCTGVA